MKRVSAPGSLSAPEFLGYTALDGDSAIARHSVNPKSLVSKTGVPH